jgi:hypothetical protein
LFKLLSGEYMKRSLLLFGIWLLLLNSAIFAQTNVRGWYAEGQVWIQWDLDNSPPETYAIYSSTNPFTNTAQAQLIGRLYEEEWTPYALRTQILATANYVIPNNSGGRFTLPANTGLFVETAHENGAKYYAVVKWGNTAVTANNLSARIEYRFSLNEPGQAQSQGTTTLASGHRSTAYYMWADGRDNHWEGRPDFPIMANRHKNGMPSFFIVSEAKNLPAGKISAVHWLHGGGGTARQSLPTGRTEINIEPQDGLLVAHNDDFIRKTLVNNVPVIIKEESNSWWFGWAKGFNPFEATPSTPANTDTVINYTQRRLLWINDWLIKNRNVDAEAVFIQGHSVGSAGTTALAKAFPNTFGSASIFNNGFGGPLESHAFAILGTSTQNLPTNLFKRNGQPVRTYEVFDLSTPISTSRDMPIMRSWAGKNDINDVMEWDAFVVAEYQRGDANAWGMQLFWDERPHGLEGMNFHWIMGLGNLQTERDEAAYQTRYRAHQSFPAFFNHQKYPGANKNPGDGTRGTGGNGVGDDWGSFGGYHDWEVSSIVDTPGKWEVVAYLIGQSSHTVDNSPEANLTSDLAIRKPQQFKPPTGRQLQWSVTRISNGQVLQSGTTAVGADDLVSITGITLFKDPDRVRIRVSDPTVAVEEKNSETLPTEFSLLQNYPNPFNPSTTIHFSMPLREHVTLKVFDVNGREVATLVDGEMEAGKHAVPFAPRSVTSGVYFYQFTAGKFSQTRKAVLMK